MIATVGSDAKKAAAQALGAAAVVSYAKADWVQQVRAATGGQGVAASFDAVAAEWEPRPCKLSAPAAWA